MNIQNVMFSLIRSEICGEKINISKDDLPNNLLENLYLLSDEHDMAHIIASALSSAGLLDNDEVSQNFNNKLILAVYFDAQREYTLKQISSILQNAKIPYITLKGAVISAYYPHSWLRTSCDIDILVHNSDTNNAIEHLCKAGFVRISDKSTHDYNLLSPNRIHVELHYTLTQDDEVSNADDLLKCVWESANPADEHSYLYKIEPEMFILYHLAHMARHLMHGGCGIRPFVDLWLIENNISYDTKKLNDMLIKTNMIKFYSAANELSKVWLENAHHTEHTKLLEKFILDGGTYGTTQNAAQMSAAKGIGKTKTLLNLIFLPRKNLEVMYPNLKAHKSLYPLYQIKRWFRFFDKNKRNKVAHLTFVRKNVSDEDENSMRELLKFLGLSGNP